MKRLHKRGRRLIAVLLLTVAAVVSVALATTASSHGRRHYVVHDSGKVAAPLRRYFRVFRASHLASASTALPEKLASGLSSPGRQTAAFGLDPSLARRVTVGGISLWAVPGVNGACLIVPSGDGVATGGICGTTASADEGKLAGNLEAGGVTTQVGLVPDGSRATLDGTPVAVVQNVYAVQGTTPVTVAP